MTACVWHTCLMPKKTAPTDEAEKLDIPALDALVAQLNEFLDSKGLSNAPQKDKAAAIGLAHQSDARKLLAKKHAPTLERVQIISDATKIPVWRLLMPIEVDRALQSLGARFQSADDSTQSSNDAPALGKGRDTQRRVQPGQHQAKTV